MSLPTIKNHAVQVVAAIELYDFDSEEYTEIPSMEVETILAINVGVLARHFPGEALPLPGRLHWVRFVTELREAKEANQKFMSNKWAPMFAALRHARHGGERIRLPKNFADCSPDPKLLFPVFAALLDFHTWAESIIEPVPNLEELTPTQRLVFDAVHIGRPSRGAAIAIRCKKSYDLVRRVLPELCRLRFLRKLPGNAGYVRCV